MHYKVNNKGIKRSLWWDFYSMSGIKRRRDGQIEVQGNYSGYTVNKFGRYRKEKYWTSNNNLLYSGESYDEALKAAKKAMNA